MNTHESSARFTNRARAHSARALSFGVVLLLMGTSLPALGTDRSFEEGGIDVVALEIVEQTARVTIEDQLATTEVTQTVRNPTGGQVEGSSRFIAGPGAHATAFAYWNGEERVDGELVEDTTASAAYDALVPRGRSMPRRDPGVLQESRAGVFSYRVFPFQGYEQKRVDLRYDRFLDRRGAAVEYRAPISLGEVDFIIRDSRGVRAVTSSSHALQAAKAKDGSWRVRALAPYSKELELRYETEEPPWTLSAWAYTEPGKDAWIAATLSVPDHVSERLARDVTILIDRSWSMKDSFLAKAQAAAERVLRGLTPADAVNIIAFDDTTSQLYPSPRLAAPPVVAEAASFVQGLRPGAGTDPYAALERALSASGARERVQHFVLITDADATRKDSPALSHAPRADRLIDLVIVNGRGAGRLEQLASATGGRVTTLDDSDGGSALAALPEDWLGPPALTDLSLEAEGAALRLIEPSPLPNVFPGGSVNISARASGQGPVRLHLRARRGAVSVDHTATVDLTAPGSPWVRAAWTYARIDGLASRALLPFREEAPGDQALRDEIVDLAFVHGSTSRFTAFVAIPPREMNHEARRELTKGRARRAVAFSRRGGIGPGSAGSIQMSPRPWGASSPGPRPERSGCASCGTQAPVEGRAAGAVSLALLAAASLRRLKRRHAGAKSAKSAKSARPGRDQP